MLGAKLWLGKGDGGFAFAESLTTDSTLDHLATADLDGDGILDFVASAASAKRGSERGNDDEA